MRIFLKNHRTPLKSIKMRRAKIQQRSRKFMRQNIVNQMEYITFVISL